MEHRQLSFMARFHDVQEVDGVQHILMEDVRLGMQMPCVMDLKTGRHCYTPWHGQEKIDSEMSKYALQSVVGFRCAGMRLESALGVVKHAKEWGRTIREDSLSILWDTFFTSARRHVANACVEQLLEMRNIIRDTFLWELYASSILLIYDSADDRAVRVVLVDFSYAYPTKETGCNNLVFGVDKLISSLSEWIEAAGPK